MDLKQIKELMGAMGRARMRKLRLKQGDFEIQLERESQQKAGEQPSVFVHSHPIPPHMSAPVMHAPAAPASGDVAAPAPAAEVAAPPVEGSFVTSPMVGTFYSSPSPDADPFIKVGDRVTEETVVCIVEAMKVMNEVKAGVSGTVKEVLLEDGQAMEFGTKILRVE